MTDRDRFSAKIVERYIELGLAVGRHIEGFVDAYYGPPELANRVRAEPIRTPDELVFEAKALLGAIDAGEPLEDSEGSSEESTKRRRWIRAQVLGVLTTARVLSGESIPYSDEVESCYGVRPRRMDESAIVASHRDLDEVVPGSGLLADRLIEWREAQAIPPDKLKTVIGSLKEDLRERTAKLFGLPDGESVEFEFVANKPWAGFNYYLGDLKSRVAINLDLPVLSTTVAHVVAHESYPGHHTEHSRKEVGLVRKRHWDEESIFLVGTPQCLVSEGLADLGLEIVFGRRPERVISEHLRPLGISYDPDVVAVIAEATEAQSAIRNEAALRLHEDRIDPEIVIQEVERFALLPKPRASKLVEFLID